MKHQFKPSRRRFMAQTGLGLLAAAVSPTWVRAMEMAAVTAGASAANRANPNFRPDVEIDLIAQAESLSILPGQPTRVLHYVAKRVSGPQDVLTTLPGSYLGPIIRLQKGQKVRINFHNRLAESSIVHWHGLHVPADMDGHPMYAIQQGQTRVYEFEVLNRAGLNIYHPHPHGATATQVYHGLAGGLIVNDDEEARLDLPSGEFEVPIVIQDKRFDQQNQLVYGSTMHDRMVGYYGDQILVNGRPNVTLDVASRAYRLRVINASTARIYKLGWSDGTPMTIIGVDGGLLPVPETLPYVMLAPGERLDVWADFSGRRKGTELSLRSLPFKGVLPKMAEQMMHGGSGQGMGGGMGHGMMGGGGMMGAMNLPVGADYPIFRIRVTREMGDSPRLPGRLSSIRSYSVDDVANAGRPIPIGLSESPMAMLINGRPYAADDIQANERIPVNSVQLIEIFHAHGGEGGGSHGGDSSGRPAEGMGGMGHGMMGHGKESGSGNMPMGGMGMMFSMAHPIHLHGQPFQIISRSIGMGEAENYATVKDGLIESGLKDTVLVMPGEKVRLIKPFQDFKGLFMYHCHNLEHEDMGMMRDFLVE